MNEVYVDMKIAHKEQPVICLWQMEERFGGFTVPKKGRSRTQHGVPIDHLADIDGPNIRCRQPRPWYMRAEDKFITEHRRHMEEHFMVLGDQIKSHTTQLSNMGGHNGNGSGDPSAECETHRHQHRVQAYANQWENGFKLNIPEFQGWLQPKEFLVTEKIDKIDKKKVLREVAEIRSQSVEEEEDGFIEEDCSLDWASPPIYDTYLDDEMSSIHQVDFLGLDAI